MTVHAVLGLAALFLLIWHTLARRYIVRVRAARDRRAFLRLAGLAFGGALLWQLGRSAKTVLALPAVSRRFTGSYETGSFTGSFPVVSWLFDYPDPVVTESWRLVIDGAVRQPMTLTYAELLTLTAQTLDAVLDCTGGWYSSQEWRGVNVGRLLALAGPLEGAASFTVAATSGYSRRFAIAEARQFILATHIAGAEEDHSPLDHGHGAPARLVAPGHRGYDWVKWVTHLQVHETSHLLQPPLPLQ
jgi:DMSO/TMAO reductase YedYZ molybdopterin-dependent catalytic subunit